MNKVIPVISIFLILLFTIIFSSSLPSETNSINIERVSVASDGSEADKESSKPAVSDDGRFIAFTSKASNLAAGTVDGWNYVYVHDRQTHVTELISVALDGQPANGSSNYTAISADGRFVAFGSTASNLVPGDTNSRDFGDIFVRDRLNKKTVRVSVASDGTESNLGSENPSISADGDIVAFQSEADNLVANDNNNQRDVFVHTISSGITQRVSVSSSGVEGNSFSGSGPEALSDDGSLVVFSSWASNLTPGDNNNAPDVFLHDLVSKQTTLISINSMEEQADNGSYLAAISGNGRYVAFVSDADNLVPNGEYSDRQVFLRDRLLGVTSLVSIGQCGTSRATWSGLNGVTISEDGRNIAFVSDSTALIDIGTVPEPVHGYQVYLHDRDAVRNALVSATPDGKLPDGETLEPPSISGNGRFVAFQSYATNLVPDDNNGTIDIFVREMEGPLLPLCNYLPTIVGK